MLRPQKLPKTKMGVRPPPPVRFPKHRAWLTRTYGCIFRAQDGAMCWGGIECAHYRFGQHAGMGEKPADWWCWSGCLGHHKGIQHIIGEPEFQRRYGLDLGAQCLKLAHESVSARADYAMKCAMIDAGVW